MTVAELDVGNVLRLVAAFYAVLFGVPLAYAIAVDWRRRRLEESGRLERELELERIRARLDERARVAELDRLRRRAVAECPFCAPDERCALHLEEPAT